MHWLEHVIECVRQGWSPEGQHVAHALKELNERVEKLEDRVVKLENAVSSKEPGTITVGPGIP